jgi:hypothetical protein
MTKKIGLSRPKARSASVARNEKEGMVECAGYAGLLVGRIMNYQI